MVILFLSLKKVLKLDDVVDVLVVVICYVYLNKFEKILKNIGGKYV